MTPTTPTTPTDPTPDPTDSRGTTDPTDATPRCPRCDALHREFTATYALVHPDPAVAFTDLPTAVRTAMRHTHDEAIRLAIRTAETFGTRAAAEHILDALRRLL